MKRDANGNRVPDFMDYLSDIHADQYIGLDDDMVDDFDNWIQDIEVDDWIKHADNFAMKRNGDGILEGMDRAMHVIRKTYQADNLGLCNDAKGDSDAAE